MRTTKGHGLIKIVHLTSLHSIDDVRIFHKECKSLLADGYKVVLVAPHDCDIEMDGVSVRAVANNRTRLGRFFLTSWDIYKKAIKEDASIYHFHDPELAFVGLLLKLKMKNVIYDIHEDLPSQIKIKHWIKPGLRPFISKIYELFENFAVSRYDGICVPQEVMKRKFIQYNNSTELIGNFALERPLIKNDDRKNRGRNIVHAGGLSEERGVLNMVSSLDYVQDGHILNLAGRFIDKNTREKVESMTSWNKVKFHGFVDQTQLASIYHDSSVGLILYNNVGQYHMAYAVKLFEFMLYEIPVVMPNFGDWLFFNEENKCGICVDVEDPVNVGEAINFLFNNPVEAAEMGRNGRRAVLEKYTWDKEFLKLSKMYKKIINREN